MLLFVRAPPVCVPAASIMVRSRATRGLAHIAVMPAYGLVQAHDLVAGEVRHLKPSAFAVLRFTSISNSVGN